MGHAREANQRNIHGKQFIDCFYDYHRNLSPESELWGYEEYCYYGGERLTHDLFEETVIDFVGEGGATKDGIAMLRRAGDYHVVGYGENINVPTIDVISTEVNFIGNLAGSYTDLCELMWLAVRGDATLHTQKYPLDDFQKALDDLDAGRVRGRAILTP